VRQKVFRFEPLEENAVKARTLGFSKFSETQSNLPFETGLIECDKRRLDLNIIMQSGSVTTLLGCFFYGKSTGLQNER